MFRRIGQKKILCINCKAILQLALKCPACDEIISVPLIGLAQLNNLKKFLALRMSVKDCIKCPVCDYKAETEKFDKVVVFKEEYSVIN
jgi:hypothetical protein